jgi:hypothetical protein
MRIPEFTATASLSPLSAAVGASGIGESQGEGPIEVVPAIIGHVGTFQLGERLCFALEDSTRGYSYYICS